MRLPGPVCAAIAAACLSLLAAPGCQSETKFDLQRKLTRLEEQLAKKDNQIAAQQVTIRECYQHLNEARQFTEEDLKKIYYPEKIEIASLSGGDDYDGQPGDDGVTVYLRPIDRDGDAVKVAGDIRIELYDLANPPEANRIGVYEVSVDQARQLWYGKLATYHYTIRCPWQHGPPRHDEITIRVTFVDYLTQRVITAQTVCTVKLVR
jgi:hypothetical protein